MRKLTYIISLAIIMLQFLPLAAEEARLLQQPAVSKEYVAFVYANDIWIVPRQGGAARRITSSEGTENSPRFSPDGATIAFTGQYDGNTDVYTVPVSGGEPKRLTYHPRSDTVRGWTPDGNRVLFASSRTSAPRAYMRLWTISIDGGMPEPLPMVMANKGDYSPGADRMAYVRVPEAFSTWRHYRGGRTTGISIIDLSNYEVESIPRDNSNDTDPAWLGDSVYFISDRNGVMNLFAFDVSTKSVRQLTFHDDYDVKSASAGGGMVVYEQAGWLHIFDPVSNQASRIVIEVSGDLPWRRPHFVKVAEMIRSADMSPTGVRAVFEARGDIFTVPAEKGDYRNLTTNTGVHDRFPAWSPDGKKIAWFSDEGGEYKLKIVDQLGREEPRSISFEEPSFYYNPAWSPDSKKILYTDKHMNVWYLDVESGKATKVDTDTYSHPERTLDPVWSPDSRWIAYCKLLESQLHAIFVFSLEDGSIHQLTDGLSDAVSPAFDKSGKYLYFLASTDYGLATGWLDLSSIDRIATRGLYLMVLSSEDPSPLLPQSDEEKVEEPENSVKKEDIGKKSEQKPELKVRIDFQGIDQRILDLDVPVRNYLNLRTGEKNIIFYGENIPNQRGFTLHRYNLEERKHEPFMEGINGYGLSADGKKLLYVAGNKWGIVKSQGKAKAGDGALNTAQLEMRVDPIAEWRQIYLESWRINRDFFYDEKMHGADWDAVYKKYLPLLDHVAHRSDLTYLLACLIGELTVGHAYVGGGDSPSAETVAVGLLGADYDVDSGHYRFKRIYTGENWNPGLRSPLTAPGLKVKEGDYLIEVNGRELKAPMNLFDLFEGTAGKQTSIRINDKPSIEGSRLVTVVPVNSETALRTRQWMEDNRRKVDELSGGRLAYVWLPDTAGPGYTNFNRYYFAQQHKQGAILDERFNGGGYAADYIIDLLKRPLFNYWATRDGKTIFTPSAAIFGPKVMIINEYAGSGGDAMPYYFRKRNIGPLVGTRTWGGLVGIYDYPDLIDGGFITAPRVAFYNTDGEWDVENIGVAPDIEVEMTPALVIQGQDPQLERAVEEALRMLEQNPVEHTPRPAPIDRTTWQKQ